MTSINDYKRAVRERLNKVLVEIGFVDKTSFEELPGEVQLAFFLDAEIDSLLAWVEGEVVPEEFVVSLAEACVSCRTVPGIFCRHQQGWNDCRATVQENFKALRGTNEPNV